MTDHILAIDVGNSRVKFGEFQYKGATVASMELAASSLKRRRDVAAQIDTWSKDRSIGRTIVAGSNPPVRDQLIEEWPDRLPEPTVIRSHHSIPMRLDVDQPEAVGIDRVLNAFAAYRINPERGTIVVDSGTATTVDLIGANGVFLGGTIFPGLRLSAYALHDYTARLPLIDVDARLEQLPSLPGRNTDEAMRAGLYWGQLGAIREIVDQLVRRNPGNDLHLILTGGGSRQLKQHFEHGQWIDSLPLLGLAMIAAGA